MDAELKEFLGFLFIMVFGLLAAYVLVEAQYRAHMASKGLNRHRPHGNADKCDTDA